MSPEELYDKKYMNRGNPENDWFVQRNKIVDVIISNLAPQPRERILDFGCNYGYFQSQISKKIGSIIYGIDINKDAIEANSNEFKYYMDATKMEFPTGYFSKIYSSHTVEHIEDLDSVFRECSRVLKPNGRMVLVYPWELVRGMAAVCAAWRVYGSPFFGGKLHVHKLNPKSIEKFTHKYFKPTKHTLKFMRTPQWVSVFENKRV